MSTTRQTIAIYWRYTRRYFNQFLISVFGSVFGVVVQDIVPPFIISRTFSKLQTAYIAHQPLHFGDFVIYLVFFALSLIVGAIIWRIQSYGTWEFEIKAEDDMANDVFRHIINQTHRFHSDRFSGALVSQTTKFLGSYERVSDSLVWDVIPGLTAFFVSLGILFFVAWQFAVVLMVITAIYVAIMQRRFRKQYPYNIASAETESNRTAALADAITNSTTIRSFAAEEFEAKRFHKIAKRHLEAMHKLSVESFKTESFSHIQTNSFGVIAFFFGLLAITHTHTKISALYLVISYTQGIVSRLWQFARIQRVMHRSFGDASEMTAILGIQPEVRDNQNPEKEQIHRGTIQFENVTFPYPENPTVPLFKDLNLRIKQGEKVGLVGPSGGGKTTLTRLLLRFMDIESGAIKIDGQDIAKLTQKDLREHIAYVPQEPMLFHRSLSENISYGEPNASKEEVEAVAKMANAHDFIVELPNQYETLVGERGVKLSGGQRQRVAIARAMLKNAPILVLDEATSALDSKSEVLIQDALWKLMENRTAIVIAHRLSTIQKMDRILVLNHGVIVEEGTHKELLQQKGLYAQLWNHQSGGFMDKE